MAVTDGGYGWWLRTVAARDGYGWRLHLPFAFTQRCVAHGGVHAARHGCDALVQPDNLQRIGLRLGLG